MTATREFIPAFALLSEAETGHESFPPPGFAAIDSCLASLPPLPPQGVLFGVSSDRLPVMLDVCNPSPGPVVALGDAASGKTDFLRFVAAATARTHRPDELQFCVLTSRPEEWDGFETLDPCSAIVPLGAGAARRALEELVAHVHEDPAANPVLLLVDNPTGLDAAALDLFHWLLLNGPAARLWPIVTLNAELALELPSWLALFRTRIFGHISRPELADKFTAAPGAALHHLSSGGQFCLRSAGHWLRFWVPSVADPV